MPNSIHKIVITHVLSDEEAKRLLEGSVGRMILEGEYVRADDVKASTIPAGRVLFARVINRENVWTKFKRIVLQFFRQTVPFQVTLSLTLLPQKPPTVVGTVEAPLAVTYKEDENVSFIKDEK